MKKSEEILSIFSTKDKVGDITKSVEPLYVMDITITEMEENNPLENRYGDYVYQCACVELSPLSFGEFSREIDEGKCEKCIINPGCTCKKS